LRVEVEYGDEVLRAEVEERLFAGEVSPHRAASIRDVSGAVERSLASPVGARPLFDLAAGKRSALVLTVDGTRASPRELLLPLLSALERAGLEATISIALGRHRKMTGPELDAHLGLDIARSFRIHQHDALARDEHKYLGTTSRGTPVFVDGILFEHDIVLAAGFLEPSTIFGFSGGIKMVVPGMALAETIDANHFLLLDPASRKGRLEGHPVREDALEAARGAKLAWITCAVQGPDDEAVAVISGDPVRAHAAACAASLSVFRVEPVEAEIVIASPGGAPYDRDMVQSKRAVEPAAACLKEGGALILVAQCRELWGEAPGFAEWMKGRSPSRIVADVRRRELFSLGAHGANTMAEPVVGRGAAVMMVTCEAMRRELEGTFVRGFESLQGALLAARERTGPDARVAVLRKARRLVVD